jgi:excisionase family DNA binding protein
MEGIQEILTAKELGHFLKLSESTIYKLASTGEIPGFKIGDSWRFDMEEIRKMIGGAKEISKKMRGLAKSQGTLKKDYPLSPRNAD